MSTTSTETLMNEKKVDGNDDAAKIFLLGDDPNAESGTLDPSDPAVTFILNSDDFINLQKYVRACTSLPSTGDLFEAEYSRENLKKFFAEDDTLYEVSHDTWHPIYFYTKHHVVHETSPTKNAQEGQ